MRSPLPLVPVMPAVLAAVLLAPPAALAQACSCGCAQPAVGYLDATGRCQCPCLPQAAPAMDAETLAGPPKPPKAGGGADQPQWTFEPLDDAGFGWPWWGGW
jgi:hypothetical protein